MNPQDPTPTEKDLMHCMHDGDAFELHLVLDSKGVLLDRILRYVGNNASVQPTLEGFFDLPIETRRRVVSLIQRRYRGKTIRVTTPD